MVNTRCLFFTAKLPDLMPNLWELQASIRIEEKPMFSLTCAMEEGCLSSSANMAQAQSSQYGRSSFGSTSFGGYGASVGLYGGKVIGHYKKRLTMVGHPFLSDALLY